MNSPPQLARAGHAAGMEARPHRRSDRAAARQRGRRTSCPTCSIPPCKLAQQPSSAQPAPRGRAGRAWTGLLAARATPPASRPWTAPRAAGAASPAARAATPRSRAPAAPPARARAGAVPGVSRKGSASAPHSVGAAPADRCMRSARGATGRVCLHGVTAPCLSSGRHRPAGLLMTRARSCSALSRHARASLEPTHSGRAAEAGPDLNLIL